MAQLVNAATNIPKSLVNCHWGQFKVTQAHLDHYQSMKDAKAALGTDWPCIRTSRALGTGEELILSGYGTGFWQRFDREQTWEKYNVEELYRLPFLQPRVQALIDKRRAADTLKRTRLKTEISDRPMKKIKA